VQSSFRDSLRGIATSFSATTTLHQLCAISSGFSCTGGAVSDAAFALLWCTPLVRCRSRLAVLRSETPAIRHRNDATAFCAHSAPSAGSRRALQLPPFAASSCTIRRRCLGPLPLRVPSG
jgi:hypothetical protein